MGRKKVHYQILTKINEIVAEDNQYFKPVIDTYSLGLADSSQYNRALRNLCNSKHPKVELILREILPFRLLLGISLTEKNKDGFSAMDYAEKNNAEAFSLLKAHSLQEMNGLMNQGVSESIQGMFGLSVEPNSPVFFQPSKGTPILSKGQDQQFKNTMKTTTDTLQSSLPNLHDIFSLSPEEANRKVREVTAHLISKVSPQNQPNESLKTNLLSLDSLWEELTIAINNDPTFAPFLTNCKTENYEAAIRSLTSLKDQNKAGQVVHCLMQYREQLGLDINKMLNSEKQTPLHQAALASNWPVYYTLVGDGANSFMQDIHGKMAQDYRRERQHSFMHQTGENPLNTILNDNHSVDPQNCVIS